jgi:hypothetical protein
MKLGKKYTTVTPLSKIIALGLFIAMPFIGFYLGMNYQSSIDKLSTPTVTVSPSPSPYAK